MDDLNHRLLQTGWGRWLLFVVGWTALSLLFVPEVYLFFLYRGEAIPWSRTAALTLANAAIVLLFLPPIVWLARRYPIERATWRKVLIVHIPACLLFSLSHSWLYAALCYASPRIFHMLFLRFHPNLLTYWAIVGFTQAGDYFRRYRERERQLAQAELHLLRAQLQPHFLFNSLHTISAMMHEDVQAADRMINRLSELLRQVLQSIGKHELPLKDELDFLHSYLEIERVRFQERLTLKLQVEPEALDALVPSMVLQPLAENSIRHGFGSDKNAGVITVHVHRRDSHLIIRFADNGRGLPTGPHSFTEGLGLTNARKCLEQLYSGDNRFNVENLSDGGAVVTLEFPYHTAPITESGVIAELLTDEDSSLDRRRRALGAKADRYTAQA